MNVTPGAHPSPGALNRIPEIRLVPINLSKCCPLPCHKNGKGYHPDISTNKKYMVQTHNGNFEVGTFSLQWYGFNFRAFNSGTCGHQLDYGSMLGFRALWEFQEIYTPEQQSFMDVIAQLKSVNERLKDRIYDLLDEKFLSTDQLCEITGYGPSFVVPILKEMEDNGSIEFERRFFASGWSLVPGF